MSDTADVAAPTEPMFRVTAGNPTPEEVAAVTVVLAAAMSSGSGSDERVRRHRGWSNRGWSNRARTMPGWASTSGWGSR